MTDRPTGRCPICGHLNETCDLPSRGWPQAETTLHLRHAALRAFAREVTEYCNDPRLVREAEDLLKAEEALS